MNTIENQTSRAGSNKPRKRLVLLRGLPSCGKSWTANRIADVGGGVVIEFDSYFEREVPGQPRVTESTRSHSELSGPHQWGFSRVQAEIANETSLIVVDNDNRIGANSKGVAAYAGLHNYTVEFAEPESPWWKTLRLLLADKENNSAALADWAQKLCLLSRNTHGMALETIVERMENWKVDLTLSDLLTWDEAPTLSAKKVQRYQNEW